MTCTMYDPMFMCPPWHAQEREQGQLQEGPSCEPGIVHHGRQAAAGHLQEVEQDAGRWPQANGHRGVDVSGNIYISNS